MRVPAVSIRIAGAAIALVEQNALPVVSRATCRYVLNPGAVESGAQLVV